MYIDLNKEQRLGLVANITKSVFLSTNPYHMPEERR